MFWTLTSSILRIVSNILTDVVCDCDEQTDGHNNDFTRCTVRILITYFTNLGVAIADGEAIYTVYVHAIYNTVLFGLISVGFPGTPALIGWCGERTRVIRLVIADGGRTRRLWRI